MIYAMQYPYAEILPESHFKEKNAHVIHSHCCIKSYPLATVEQILIWKLVLPSLFCIQAD